MASRHPQCALCETHAPLGEIRQSGHARRRSEAQRESGARHRAGIGEFFETPVARGFAVHQGQGGRKTSVAQRAKPACGQHRVGFHVCAQDLDEQQLRQMRGREGRAGQYWNYAKETVHDYKHRVQP